MLRFYVNSNSTVFEPRTPATATTSFARFPDSAAFRACGNGDCRPLCRCVDVTLVKTQEGISFNGIVKSKHILYALGLEPTFAGCHALKPLVINIFVAGTSTVLKPSTARGATTASA